jgi:hypothetical protein
MRVYSSDERVPAARPARRARDGRHWTAHGAPAPGAIPTGALRTGVIALTRNRLAAADRHEGRRGLWLRTLDRLGLVFDS